LPNRLLKRRPSSQSGMDGGPNKRQRTPIDDRFTASILALLMRKLYWSR